MSRDLDVVIRAARMVTPDGETAGAVGIRDGEIVAVDTSATAADLTGVRTVQLADDEVLLPGVVDAHVHVNDPGRTEWEGFASATRAAAAGGVTTIVDMPLNSIPPTCDVVALDLKRKTAASQALVDVGFWGGAVPGNLADLRPLHEAGVSGFKCFLLHSGVDEFPPLDAEELKPVMREIGSFDGLLIVHAEDAHTIDHAPAAAGGTYEKFLNSRPREAENLAIEKVIELSRRTGCRVHILHVSSADVLATLATARRDGVRVTAETCPHYLTFAAEEIPDGATQFKCCPPIREGANREQLWEGLRDGVIDMVVTDHSPSTPDLKALDTGDFGVAWGGISSLQLGLSAVWTGARERGFALADVVRWMSQATARHAGLARKGSIAVGHDADLCVFAPDDSYVVDAASLHHKNAVTPYHGRTLAGVVRQTWLRGEKIDIEAAPQGRLLTREGARP
ncbi:allantoinase [Nocardioides luteus]|uniref:allantoinase n=1 Tax=Nocardioides luteus TaxID=1844 RepID=A0ABQ5T4D5_9ACTN|nr:allantoinase AllB [Nocardioides luteus]MDR7313488.1 allantoinase [Nocardioides luteus]GGR74542.1 allantoinase [Nocardioides luteus]GLJ70743.1 allantoinase [Nocardioides luteus]